MLGRLFSRKKRASRRSSDPWDLDTPLIHWSQKDDWTIRASLENTLCIGATGSGKTSGSGHLIAKQFLLAGYGGMVMCVKNDRPEWERLAEQTGRSKDLLIWGADSGLTFNFLDWEMRRPTRGAGYTENVLSVFMQVMETINRGGGNTDGREDASYFINAMKELMRGCIDLLAAAGQPITVKNISQVIVSAPKSRAEVTTSAWADSSYCCHCIAEGQRRCKTIGAAEDFESIKDYWCYGFAGLADKTRSSVVSTQSSIMSILSRGLLRELLCTDTTLTPDVMEQGKIVVLDMPVQQYGTLGQVAQQIMKFSFFQKSMERRDVKANPRPVFLFVDEAQFFAGTYDMLFMSASRASHVANVYLTQNISNLYAALGGGPKAEAETNSMLGNCGTKIMHANSDHVTTEWQANLIGRRIKPMMSGSNSHGGQDWAMAALGLGHAGDTSAGYAEQMQYQIEPAEFSHLKTGGPSNKRIVQGIVFQNGKQFQASGRSWLLVDFQQEG